MHGYGIFDEEIQIFAAAKVPGWRCSIGNLRALALVPDWNLKGYRNLLFYFSVTSMTLAYLYLDISLAQAFCSKSSAEVQCKTRHDQTIPSSACLWHLFHPKQTSRKLLNETIPP